MNKYGKTSSQSEGDLENWAGFSAAFLASARGLPSWTITDRVSDSSQQGGLTGRDVLPPCWPLAIPTQARVLAFSFLKKEDISQSSLSWC